MSAYSRSSALHYNEPYMIFFGILVIRGQVLILRDMNAHSFISNPPCWQNVISGPLKEFVESYKLIVNNDVNCLIRPSSPE